MGCGFGPDGHNHATILLPARFHGRPGKAAGQPRGLRSPACATGRLRATGRSTVGSLVLAPEAETHPRPDWRERKVWLVCEGGRMDGVRLSRTYSPLAVVTTNTA